MGKCCVGLSPIAASVCVGDARKRYGVTRPSTNTSFQPIPTEGVQMQSHYCLDESYPGGKITCLCVRGVDHEQALFDVPVGEEPEED